jgi:hypothetical protein
VRIQQHILSFLNKYNCIIIFKSNDSSVSYSQFFILLLLRIKCKRLLYKGLPPVINEFPLFTVKQSAFGVVSLDLDCMAVQLMTSRDEFVQALQVVSLT